jgi:hypothetical protein
MLLALAKKLRANVPTGDYGTNLPVGTLTVIAPYDALRYGDIEGIGLVTIDATGNMVGFSPVERCQDKHGEIAWIPTELIRNLRSQPFAFTGEKVARGTRVAAEK